MSKPGRFQFLSPYRVGALLPVLIFWGLFFVVPLLLVMGVSFTTRGTYGGFEWNFTFSNYVRFIDPLYWNIYARSFLLAFVTTGICLVLSFPLAYVIARAPHHTQQGWLFLVMIPFWTNFLVLTYAWIFILRTEGLLNTQLINLKFISKPLNLLYTDGAVLLGLVYGYLPFMILPLYVALERIPVSLEEAARDLYAGGWAVFRKVIFPLSQPGIVAGCILVFVPSLGAFITPHLLGGGQSMMLGTLIQHAFLVVRDWPFGSAPSFVLMIIVLILALILSKRQRVWSPS